MTPSSDLPDPRLGLPAAAVPPAERERVVEALTRHFAADQIAEADLERRLDRVYRAMTVAELHAVLADLPALASSGATPTLATDSAPERVAAFLSGQDRKMSGVVPRELLLRARLGYVELDLTRATFAPGVTTIDVRAFMGYVQIRFPAGVRVESDGHAVIGFFSLKGAATGETEPAASVVRVTGRASFGFAECVQDQGRAGPPAQR
jgi:hypothetical protein